MLRVKYAIFPYYISQSTFPILIKMCKYNQLKVIFDIPEFQAWDKLITWPNLILKYEVAIRTAPVSEHSFAIRTAMLTHMRSEAMFNLFVRRWF